MSLKMIQLPDGVWVRASEVVTISAERGYEPKPGDERGPPVPMKARVWITLRCPKLEAINIECPSYDEAKELANSIGRAVCGQT